MAAAGCAAVCLSGAELKVITAGFPRCFPQSAVTVEHLVAALASSRAPPEGIIIVADRQAFVIGPAAMLGPGENTHACTVASAEMSMKAA